MRIIDLVSPTLSLITPVQIETGKRMNFYSSTEIEDGDILYANGEKGYTIYRAHSTTCSKQRRAIRIGGTDRKPILAPYMVRTYLQEIKNKKELDRVHGLMIEVGELPW
ncbi:hypothetical protein [Neolewinella agarilytica]|uniref:Uncharacterized protein n=1 Tax=Neolewinella agarilytica TaxID=478744 RepID=A0A1H9LYV9_9BACT|nr:hypothetical protein [Neolewinella agarilytica]SER16611.1 hypothetical protein SAMN05444359_12644 [Neolewinella agarilytica]